MVQDSDGPELNQFKDSHGSKKDSGIRAGSVRHVLEDFVVVINRTKPVKRPVFRNSDSDHIGDGNQAAIAVILMIAGVGGIGAIVAHDEHVALGHGYREREGARVHAGANVGGLIDGHAVEVTGWPAPLHSTTSPGRPISRLMRYPPPGALLCSSFNQLLGSLNTTTSSRCRSKILGVSLLVTTRSPGTMVSIIEREGIS